jgi:hypothetical protein
MVADPRKSVYGLVFGAGILVSEGAEERRGIA